VRCASVGGAAARRQIARPHRWRPSLLLPGRTSRPRLSPEPCMRLRSHRCRTDGLRGGMRPVHERRRDAAMPPAAHVQWTARPLVPGQNRRRRVSSPSHLELGAPPQARGPVRGEITNVSRSAPWDRIPDGEPCTIACSVRGEAEGEGTWSSRSRTAPGCGPPRRGEGAGRGRGNSAHMSRCWKAVRTRASAASAR